MLAALLIAVMASSLPAQQWVVDKRLVLAVAPEFGVSRAHAPVALEVSLRWNSSELIEGRLQLDWFVDTTRLGRFVSSELALSDSSIKLNVQLPPVMLAHDDAVVSVQGKFITEGTVYYLDEHDLALQPDWRRILVAAVCTTPRSPEASIVQLEGAEPRNKLSQSFRLEPFFEDHFTRRELMVENAEVDPTDVPDDPLKMTAFDLFIIPADAMSKLKPRQLESLLTWTRAGGSLCVFVDSTLPPTQLEWLNRLAGRDMADAAYLRGPDDHIIAAESATDGLYRHNVDLGRAVVTLGKANFSAESWEQAVLFLWKVRADRCLAAADGKLWTADTAPFHDGMGMYITLEPQRIWQRSGLEGLLMPDSVRGLSLGTVSLMLAVFLLLIAPGDYFLLGWLKRRRWTWILFPVLSLAFTGYTMWLAQQHLGRTSYDHSITVVDLGDDGTPVRTSRFDMLYAASTCQVNAEFEDQLMVPLDPNMGQLAQHSSYMPYMPGSGPLMPTEYEPPWTYSGRVPQHYAVQRDVQQWAPRLARVTWFGGEAPAGDRPDVVSRLHGDDVDHLVQGAGVPQGVAQLAISMTKRSSSGFFSVVSRVSPTAGGNWEDLALLDPSDPQQTAIIEIRKPAEGQYVITRRLERKQD